MSTEGMRSVKPFLVHLHSATEGGGPGEHGERKSMKQGGATTAHIFQACSYHDCHSATQYTHRMSFITQPSIRTTHNQSMRSTTITSTPITQQSTNAKDAKRQDSSHLSYLSNLFKPLQLLKPLKMMKRPSVATVFCWVLINIYIYI